MVDLLPVHKLDTADTTTEHLSLCSANSIVLDVVARFAAVQDVQLMVLHE